MPFSIPFSNLLHSWYYSEVFGSIWKHLKQLEAFGKHLGSIWEYLETVGNIGKHLGAFGSIWKHWEAFGKHLGSIWEELGPIQTLTKEARTAACSGFFFGVDMENEMAATSLCISEFHAI